MTDAEQRRDVEDSLESAVVATWAAVVTADLSGVAGTGATPPEPARRSGVPKRGMSPPVADPPPVHRRPRGPRPPRLRRGARPRSRRRTVRPRRPLPAHRERRRRHSPQRAAAPPSGRAGGLEAAPVTGGVGRKLAAGRPPHHTVLSSAVDLETLTDYAATWGVSRRGSSIGRRTPGTPAYGFRLVPRQGRPSCRRVATRCVRPDLAAAQLDSRTTRRQGTVRTPGSGLPPMASSSRSAACRPISARSVSIVVRGGRHARAMTSQLS